MLNKCIEKITEQQKNYTESDLEYSVGEMHKKIASINKTNAEIILQDLNIKEMDITACGKKMYEYARSNKKKSSYCMTDKTAEFLIYDFYKLPKKNPKLDLSSLLY